MPEYILPIGAIFNESEFNAGSGACGPTALAGIKRWHDGKRAPLAKQVMNDMIGWKLCSSTGVSTLRNLHQAAINYRLSTHTRSSASISPLSFAARSLNGTAGYAQGMSLLFLTNGQALIDYLTRFGEDASGLQGHFIAVFGYNSGGYSSFLGCQVPGGFHAIDGDNNLQNPVVPGVGRIHRFINQSYCYYPTSVLTDAQASDVFSVSK